MGGVCMAARGSTARVRAEGGWDGRVRRDQRHLTDCRALVLFASYVNEHDRMQARWFIAQ